MSQDMFYVNVSKSFSSTKWEQIYQVTGIKVKNRCRIKNLRFLNLRLYEERSDGIYEDK